MQFPDVFITGELPQYKDKRELIADALCGWAVCMCGTEPPKQFGVGMAAIGKELGITPTPDNIDKLAEEFLNNKDLDRKTLIKQPQ